MKLKLSVLTPPGKTTQVFSDPRWLCLTLTPLLETSCNTGLTVSHFCTHLKNLIILLPVKWRHFRFWNTPKVTLGHFLYEGKLLGLYRGVLGRTNQIAGNFISGSCFERDLMYRLKWHLVQVTIVDFCLYLKLLVVTIWLNQLRWTSSASLTWV